MKISEAKFAESSTRVHQKPAEPIAGQILPDNPFKFIGKEKAAGSGLSLYDFGARWYNPATPAWTTPDPLAEKYYDFSPYVYCAGNPVNLADPEGLAWVPRNGSSDEFAGFDWVEEETVIQENGQLPDGVYNQAIYFTDNGTFDGRTRRNMGSSIAVVYLADGTIQTYNRPTYLKYYPYKYVEGLYW